ncbi:hypothetical protein H6G20_25175 [Desertifilum sp. FACHB-1129]|uniref:Uncharacterized protein n=1 Tax=Desertifilum tharense IPPAS B-1220 TaxID=1781255 RepID=A0A1E5QF09_9CYAN|nr:YaaW family protein [Desertifilum tharense]MBD2314965.1 hypothetical protein [Desertifilum sp. FACHB-1129]MBD2325214.1 hypothetical protein [Desertifilum sp. FACHB-866]MBD2335336.1 hypothetical protein [Desertifilum sp. FACHB-868]MDA0213538.1 YaaW family protein [Cyanobacteria bacterium FC1]OEJ73239.1 hypothetical protein BH720_20775 [Desertifilum tharense IPPAS B-1220]
MDELRSALELATEDELQQLTELLFRRQFNPLDYVYTPDPIDIQSLEREEWLDALEARFRFLAADGIAVLRGRDQQVTYRQVLIQVCRYLKFTYSDKLSTTELEAEVFLNLLRQTWQKLPAKDRKSLAERVRGAIANSDLSQPLPLALQKDPLGILLKGGSAIAISSIKPLLLQKIAQQFALHYASYQVAKEALVKGGVAAASKFQGHLALQTAKRGMTLNAARYGLTRGVFAVVGPALWAYFFADLGWRAISTNYGRIIPAVFALAQIRLTRSECWELA